MSIIKAKKKKNIWADNYRPYGVNEGERGSTSQWKHYFDSAMGIGEAQAIVKDSSPYGILGLSMGCTWAEVKKAFRTLIKIHHPDVGGDRAEFEKVYASYSILKEKLNG